MNLESGAIFLFEALGLKENFSFSLGIFDSVSECPCDTKVNSERFARIFPNEVIRKILE